MKVGSTYTYLYRGCACHPPAIFTSAHRVLHDGHGVISAWKTLPTRRVQEMEVYNATAREETADTLTVASGPTGSILWPDTTKGLRGN
jgi:hypothetical protein